MFTNLSQDHLDYHPSLGAYFEAKAQLFEAPYLKGKAVVNLDDRHGRRLAMRLGENCWRSSLEDPAAELRMEQLRFSATGVSGLIVTPLGEAPFQSPWWAASI